MHIRDLFKDDVEEQYRLKFKKEITLINITRGRLFGTAILLIETILFIIYS